MQKPNNQSNNKNKKVQRKFVTIKNSELLKTHLNTKYKKWQLKIAKWIGVEVADTYQYSFRIDYVGSARLKVNDVVSTQDGELFGVMREQNRIAVLASSIAYVNKPVMRGKLYIIEKPKNRKS